ncbi:PAS domain-containing protein [Pseudodesulfovibrio sp.]|nr:PAS domain-containing protein [Pseudodesulfovibrio sp.]
MSINVRVFTFITLIASLLLGISVLIYNVSYTALEERVIANAELIAEQVTQQVHRNILFVEENMKQFAVSSSLEGRDSRAPAELPSNELLEHRFIRFYEMEYGYKIYESIAIFDIRGDILRGTCDCVNPSQTAWWKDAVEHGISYALVETANRGKLVGIAVALHDSDGQVWSIMQAMLSMSSMIRGGGLSLNKLNARQIDLITLDGTYLYSTALHKPGGKVNDYAHSQIHDQLDNHIHEEGTGIKTLDITVPHKHGKHGGLEWILILRLNYEKTFAHVLNLRWWIGGSILLLILLGGVFIIFITHYISTPLIKITEAVARFGRGEMKGRISGEYKGEFSALASTFNKMAHNISESQELLEAKVEKRTQDLLINNEQLLEEIEERERAQEALNETSAILQAAMDCSPAGIAIAEAPDGRLRYVNKAGLSIRQASPDEVIEDVTISNYLEKWKILDVDGSPLEAEDIPLTRALIYGETNDRQFIIRRPDQEDRVVWAHAAPVVDDMGNIIAAVVVFPDITEIKKTENALREREERLKDIIAKAPVPMIVIEEGKRISVVNEAMVKTLGYDLNDIPTMNDWWQLTYPDGKKRKEVIDSWKNTVNEARDHGLDIAPIYKELTRKDGKQRSVEFSLILLGESIVVSMQDLTDHLRLIEELTAKEARLSEAQRVANLGSWEWTISTGELWWSDEVYRIFGLAPDRSKMTYEKFTQMIHADDKEDVEKSIRLAIAKNEAYNAEHRIVLPDGSIKTVQERSHIEYDKNGEPIYMLGSVQDITEMKAIENQLINASKLESIGQLAAGIAHEINTPVQFLHHNIKFFQDGFNDLVELLGEYENLKMATESEQLLQDIHTRIRDCSQSLDYDYLIEEIPKSLGQSMEGLDRIARIVQSVKQFAHSGLSEKRLVDINQIVNTVVTVSTNEWKYDSEVHLDLDKMLPNLMCAPDMINQALLNILINAAHTNTERVKVGDIDKAGIYISTRYEDGQIVIAIRDDGMGIPEPHRERIFDPFFTTKDVGQGTGQGLAMVQRTIVGEHDGTITVESTIQGGTTFTIRLPK